MQEAIHRPLVIGHRGAPAHQPENTLRAFREAMRAGADGVELDVREARDGTLVVHHDPVLAGDGVEVAALDLGEIRARGPADADLRVPTLGEALEELRALAPRIVLVEVKDARSPERLRDLLAASALDLPITTMSFDLDLMRRLRELDGVMRLGLVSAETIPRAAEFLVLHRLDALVLRHDRVDGALATDLHAAGKALYAWTVNEESDLRRLLPFAPTGIITDDPGWARGILTHL